MKSFFLHYTSYVVSREPCYSKQFSLRHCFFFQMDINRFRLSQVTIDVSN